MTSLKKPLPARRVLVKPPASGASSLGTFVLASLNISGVMEGLMGAIGSGVLMVFFPEYRLLALMLLVASVPLVPLCLIAMFSTTRRRWGLYGWGLNSLLSLPALFMATNMI